MTQEQRFLIEEALLGRLELYCGDFKRVRVSRNIPSSRTVKLQSEIVNGVLPNVTTLYSELEQESIRLSNQYGGGKLHVNGFHITPQCYDPNGLGNEIYGIMVTMFFEPPLENESKKQDRFNLDIYG